MRNFLFSVAFLFPILLSGQISEDFSDGDLTSSPVWEGDLSSFQIGLPPTSSNGSLNSDAGNDAFVLSSSPSINDAIITTSNPYAYGEWQFSVADGSGWSISSANDYLIILMSDQNTVANLTDGSLDFNGYFLRFDGGESDQFILYKQTGTTSAIVIDTDYPATVDGSTPLGRTVKITRSDIGDWSVFIDEGFAASPTTQRGTTVNDNDHTTSTYFGISTNISSPGTARVLYFDNLQIIPLPTNNQTSTVSAGAASEPTNIPSTIDTEAEILTVFDFNITDLGSGDNLETIIDQLIITQGDLNGITDWTNAIIGATLTGPDFGTPLAGTINAQNIAFAIPSFITIADGTSETYSLNIWLKQDLSAISDNDILDFKLDAANISCDLAGSGFGLSSTQSGAESITIEATKQVFGTIPTAILTNNDFSINLTALDENNNIDTDFSEAVTLSTNSGTGILSSTAGLSLNYGSGTCTWADLQYDTEEIFSIKASSSLGDITSSDISCFSTVVYLDDNFEDADLAGWQSANLDRWAASSEAPLNGAFSLKHVYDNPDAGIDKIAYPLGSVNLSEETKTWRFQIKYINSAPSGNNNWSVFLMADANETQMSVGGAINGYLVGIDFSGTDDIVKLSEITNGVETVIINTGYDWNTIDEQTPKGFQINRTPAGDWGIMIDDNGSFNNLISYGTANSTVHTTADYFGIYYKYSSTSDRQLTIDDTYFGSQLVPNDNDSQLAAGAGSEPTDILSIKDTEAEAVQILDFTITDLGTADILPTIIDQIKITQGDLNEITDWTSAISGATLTGTDISTPLQATIVADTITFIGDNFISVESGTSETYNLKIWLKSDLSTLGDNQKLDFKLNSADCLTNETGSGIASSTLQSGAENISIEATHINFVSVPQIVMTDATFGITANCTDENNNIDTDFSGTLTIALETGNGNLNTTSSLTQSATNGSVSWADLTYDTEENITLSLSAAGLASAVSNPIAIKNIAYFLDDDFETGNLAPWINTNDWIASDISPIDELYSLKHNLTGVSGTSYFSRKINGLDINADTTYWKFNVKYTNSDPSSSNNFTVMIMSNQSDLSSTEELSAYMVGVNMFGASNDTITFGKYANGEFTEIIKTDYKWTGNTVGFEIERSKNGAWTVRLDIDGGFDNLVEAGKATDTSLSEAEYFGAKFNFTSTNAGKFWFDNAQIMGAPDVNAPQIISAEALSPTLLKIKFNEYTETSSTETPANYSVDLTIGNAQTAVQDTQSPDEAELSFATSFTSDTEYTLTSTGIADLNQNISESQSIKFTYSQIEALSATAVSNTKLDILFSKAVDATLISNLTNYTVNGTIGNPTNVSIDGENPALVHLTFAESFTLEEIYTISIQNITDTYSNSIESTNLDFFYYEVQAFDIVFNEIMCDVSPYPVAIPAYKYVEIYNNGKYDIDLSGWTLTIGTNSPIEFPAATIQSGAYAIICEESAAQSFNAFGQTIPILSASQLTTSGKRLVITSADNNTIDDIEYDLTWYNDDDKDAGGWSLERIDPTNFCESIENWTACENPVGGTPGMKNSTFAANPDITAPRLKEIFYNSSKSITLVFSEKTEETAALLATNYSLNENINPTSVIFNESGSNSVILFFANNFTIGKNSLQIKNISDNCGNTVADIQTEFEYKLIYPTFVEVIKENQLRVHFSEKVDLATAQTILNYTVNNNIGNPQIATINNADSSLVSLQFATNFTYGEVDSISIANVNDKNANTMLPAKLAFAYYIPKQFDIVFNEIMCDVSPAPLALPAQRYVELYNRTDYDINLNDWFFAAEGQTMREFPETILPHNEYLILCESEASGSFSDFGEVLEILGSSDLSTTGKRLRLMRSDSTLIDEVDYSDTWYNSSDESHDGLSLERIDTENFCGGDNNWNASNAFAGGTPGNVNSISTSNIDTAAPILNELVYVSSKEISLVFSESIAETSGLTTTNYTLNSSINPTSAIINDETRNIINLKFTNNFTLGQNTLLITSIGDNCENMMPDSTITFEYNLIYPKSVEIVKHNQLRIHFSEKVDLVTAQNVLNYSVNNGIGNPEFAAVNNTDSTLVSIQFATSLTLGALDTISIANVNDINANTMLPAKLPFAYYIANPNDIVFNEIMCDVSPAPVGLPEARYIEFYNQTDYDIDLTAWKFLAENQSMKTFPSAIIPAKDYLILCESGNKNLFEMYGETVNILGSTDLSTTGKNLKLMRPDSTIIDEVEYTDAWYGSSEINHDGLSLERIDVNNFCGGGSNWNASTDVKGGTPGSENSIIATNPDNSAPKLSELIYNSSKSLTLIFSENLDENTASRLTSYNLNSSINPASADLDENDRNTIDLTFANNFATGQNTLLISEIGDNCGNTMPDSIANFEYNLIYPESLAIVSQNQLRLYFSENVDFTSAQNLLNYSVTNGIGNPATVTINNTDNRIINLVFAANFTLGAFDTISIANIKDINGNTMLAAKLPFTYYIANPHDIVFNEIMCDVSPAPLGLPEAKYIELYNRTNYDIDLANWLFMAENQSMKKFPSVIIPHSGYLILCESGDKDLFETYGEVVNILSSTDLSTTGKKIKLMRQDSTVIDEVNYSDTWYDAPEDNHDGLSLERIDVNNFCGNDENWNASTDIAGGTPGKANSIQAENVATITPELDSVSIVSSTEIQIYFMDDVSKISAQTVANYTINNGIENPVSATRNENDYKNVTLFFANQLQDQTHYTLTISNITNDCDLQISETDIEFDYFRIKPIELSVESQNQLKITFSETVELSSATNTTNYSADNGLGNPQTVIREELDDKTVYLEFASPFPTGAKITLNLTGITDVNGNAIAPAAFNFTYYVPQASDLVINEVLFNPFTDGSDFVEIYNRSESVIDLSNISLATRDADGLLKTIVSLADKNTYMNPQDYVAVTTSKENTLRFYMSLNEDGIHEISSMPTYANDDGIVVLLYNDSIVIDEFAYSEDMQFGLLDDNNGVSLERINYDLATQDETNWHSASEFVGFATPAYKNSQFRDIADGGDSEIFLEPEVFSPDNDGMDDYLNIHYNFDSPGYVGNIYIFDAQGRMVERLGNNVLLSKQGTVQWTGIFETGEKARMGIYVIYFEAFGLDGKTIKFKKTCTLAGKL